MQCRTRSDRGERLSDVERGGENHSAGGRRGSDRLGGIENASTETVRLEWWSRLKKRNEKKSDGGGRQRACALLVNGNERYGYARMGSSEGLRNS